MSVREFHEAFGITAPGTPTVPDEETIDMRVTLLCEEFAEVMGALFNCGQPDVNTLAGALHAEVESMVEARRSWGVDTSPRMVDLAKELADLRYVTDGCAVTFGIDPDAVFEIVHNSNMSKLGASGEVLYREDGKVLKGPLFQPAEPRIEKLLDAS